MPSFSLHIWPNSIKKTHEHNHGVEVGTSGVRQILQQVKKKSLIKIATLAVTESGLEHPEPTQVQRLPGWLWRWNVIWCELPTVIERNIPTKLDHILPGGKDAAYKLLSLQRRIAATLWLRSLIYFLVVFPGWAGLRYLRTQRTQITGFEHQTSCSEAPFRTFSLPFHQRGLTKQFHWRDKKLIYKKSIKDIKKCKDILKFLVSKLCYQKYLFTECRYIQNFVTPCEINVTQVVTEAKRLDKLELVCQIESDLVYNTRSSGCKLEGWNGVGVD